MSQLTDSILRQIMPNAPKARRALYLPYLNAAAYKFGITTELRMAAWLATLAVESAELRYTSEIGVHPEYEGRRDLGNTQKGDGVKFEGHGLIQLTGRDVHQQFANYVKRQELMKRPELIANEPELACLSAAWFVSVYKKLNQLADRRQFLQYQVRVNGRNRKTRLPNHWTERKAYYERALRALPDDFELTLDEPVQFKSVPIEEIEDNQDATLDDLQSPDFTDVDSPAFDKGDLSTPNSEDDTLPAPDHKNGSDGIYGQNRATSEPDQIIVKERPSTFTRWMTAIKIAIGGLLSGFGGWFGTNEIGTQIANKAIDKAEPSWFPILALTIGITLVVIGSGIFLIWVASKFYDKSAERSNKLNQEKLGFAARYDLNTVDFRK